MTTPRPKLRPLSKKAQDARRPRPPGELVDTLPGTRLEAYLSLERLMLALDAVADPRADQLRDVMDPLWYSLTDQEHTLLDARTSRPARSTKVRL